MTRYLMLALILAATGLTPVHANQPEDMSLISGGTFEMGVEGGEINPLHTVTVGSFLIDTTEVTNAQYAAFCAETERALPVFWNMERFRCGEEFPNHPVVGVSHRDATAYAKWADKRLPTEAEWEFAARGGLVGMAFPNGDEADPEEVNHKRAGNDGTLPVGSLKPNGYGLHDMSGNVREWVEDRYARGYDIEPVVDPVGPEVGRFRVVRGGGWYSGPGCNRVDGRNALNAAWGDFNVGFRCAKDVD